MKVAFLKAPVGGIIGLEMITFVEPLGLECVAGGLEEQGHDCRIVDLRIDGFEPGLARVRAFEPEVVGLQCNFTTERFRLLRLTRLRLRPPLLTPTLSSPSGEERAPPPGPLTHKVDSFVQMLVGLAELARRVKELLPEALLVGGGHDASRDPGWFLHPTIDVMAVGDGEEILPELVEAHERGENLARVPGLLLNRPGGPVDTGHAPARGNIDELPMPARHLRAHRESEARQASMAEILAEKAPRPAVPAS